MDMALNLKYVYRALAKFDHICGRMKRSAAGIELQPPLAPGICLNKVFSSSLDSSKTWYALNVQICCSKPVAFCSSSTSKVFPEEYKHVRFNDLRDQDGVTPPFKWFNSHQRNEMVYVASSFGLLVGILRAKKLEECPLLLSDKFAAMKELINAKGFDFEKASLPEPPGHWLSHSKALEAQLASAAQEIVSLRSNLRRVQNVMPTSPSTPSPPKPGQKKIPPKPNSDTSPGPTITELKSSDDFSPATKKRKLREKSMAVMEEIKEVCESHGESLATVLGECCSLTRTEDEYGVLQAIRTAFSNFSEECGVKKAFKSLLPDTAWEERVDLMRVPDWVYLLIKLKSRLSDDSWQTFTSLTKLGRTGVSLY